MAIRFGAQVVQAVPYVDLLDDIHFVESLGLDNAWIVDAFAFPVAPDLPILEAWTTLAALARDTQRIRIGALVTNVATRNPALLAKQALTVDQLSGGRLDLAVGAGFDALEHAYLGVEFPDGPRRSERLAEAVTILDRGLRAEHVTFEGHYFQVADAPMHPAPTQIPRVPLFIAAQAVASLQVAVQHGDAVVAMSDPGSDVIDRALARFRDRMAKLDELCAVEGRAPDSLRRCYSAGYEEKGIFASPGSVADWIGRFIEAGATDFAFKLNSAAQPTWAPLVASGQFADRDMLARVAQDVFPLFASGPD